jgi:hypothetical protein
MATQVTRNGNFQNRLKRYTALLSTKEVSKMVDWIKTPCIQHTALDLQWFAWLEIPPIARNIKIHPVLFLGKAVRDAVDPRAYA